MAVEPHTGGILDKEFPYVAKSDVEGRLVCILDARSETRHMELIIQPSRVVPKHEIHELVMTDDPVAAPRRVFEPRTIDRVAFVCFFLVTRGGLLLVGDTVEIDGSVVGQVAGFDLTHAPNHMNILVYTTGERRTGLDLGLALDQRITFSGPNASM
ncbi:MAG: hypothetical protein M5U01_14560 [Ardenticatenaceae bacterium]|nr:hypothetical protein [Ardenticatenaceae bacterium]